LATFSRSLYGYDHRGHSIMAKKTRAARKGPFPPKQRATAEDVAVGQRVRALRLERDMSQSALGQALGVTFQQVQKYEKGVNRIGASRLQALSDILEVPITAFFGEKKRASSPTLFDLATSPGAVELLRAYENLSDPKARRHLVQLAKSMAGLSGNSAGK
jgi:transcriptional regulator with XRE-family HTH domain